MYEQQIVLLQLKMLIGLVIVYRVIVMYTCHYILNIKFIELILKKKRLYLFLINED